MPKQNDYSIPRRFSPPISWLVAFEAVERRGSVTAAGAELSLTQSAISRQIQKLEKQLGVQLFERDKQRLHITDLGRTYAADVREGINLIVNAGIKMHTNPSRGTLELSVLPAFGAHWLVPKLNNFMDKFPGITLNLTTKTEPFDFSREDFHAAIHFGSDDWPGSRSLLLMQEETVAVVSPNLGLKNGKTDAKSILKIPLLHLRSRPNAWSNWFSQKGIELENTHGFQFDQFASMIQASIFGLGAAIVPKYLIASELKEGRLVCLFASEPLTIGSYYLVWPDRCESYPPLEAFRTWIKQTIDEIQSV
ncbi:MAG: LysR substrate-binding domain-containing protein [Amylibacter sp.]|nr:LysR substrate-binding domain-containing protein [Amylibacter sp.]